MVYLWSIPESYKNKDIGMYDYDTSPDHFILMDGRHISSEEFNSVPVFHFEVSKDRVLKFDCLPNNALDALVNSRVKNILEENASNDVQFFKAKLICNDGEINDYYLVNALHTINGINHEKSVYRKMDTVDSIMSIKSITYYPDCMKEHKIARDEEYEVHFLVSETMKDIFDKERVTGVRFIRPEDFYAELYSGR